MTTISVKSDGETLTLFGLPAPNGLPVHYVSPYIWRASANDEGYLRSRLPYADWSAVPPKVLRALGAVPGAFGGVRLYDYQKEALRRDSRGLLLADEPSLGKTIMAIAFCLDRGAEHVAVICRASVRQQWADHLDMMAAGSYRIVESRETEDVDDLPRFLITSYDRLPSLERYQSRFDAAILDEAHAIKNPHSDRTKRSLALFKGAKYRILLTGTPIRNYTADLWPLLCLVDPVAFGDRETFYTRYCGPKIVKDRGGQRVEYRGTTKWDELMLRIEPIYLSRTKDEVGLEIPPKVRSTIPIRLSNEAEYRAAERELTYAKILYGRKEETRDPAVENPMRAAIMTKILKLRQIAAVGKVPMVADWIGDRGGLLIFTSFVLPAELLFERLNSAGLPGAAILQGDVPPPDRPALLRRVREGGSNLIATTGTGGESLNLQDLASTALFVDVDWSPATMSQAEDRIHRPGQTADSVQIVYFTAETSIEDRMYKKLLSKIDASPLLRAQFDPVEVLE